MTRDISDVMLRSATTKLRLRRESSTESGHVGRGPRHPRCFAALRMTFHTPSKGRSVAESGDFVAVLPARATQPLCVPRGDIGATSHFPTVEVHPRRTGDAP